MQISAVFLILLLSALASVVTAGGKGGKMEDKMKDKKVKGYDCFDVDGQFKPEIQVPSGGAVGGKSTTKISKFKTGQKFAELKDGYASCDVMSIIEGAPDGGFQLCTVVMVTEEGSFTATGYTTGYFDFILGLTSGTGSYFGLLGEVSMQLINVAEGAEEDDFMYLFQIRMCIPD